MVVKRFVAGAVCPRCAEMDKLRTWRDEQREFRECVSCGYQDAMRLDGAKEPQELDTRVNRPEQPVDTDSAGRAKIASEEVQVVQFVPNPVKKQ